MTPITEEPPPDYFSLEPKPEEGTVLCLDVVCCHNVL